MWIQNITASIIAITFFLYVIEKILLITVCECVPLT